MNFEFAFWSNNAIYLSVYYLMIIKRSNCDLFEDSEYETGDSSPNLSVLNVAENEDAAETIVKFLSGENAKTRNGITHHNKIYEFQHNLQGRRRNMIMTSVSGHLLGFEFSGMYRGWTSCSPESLFEAPLTKLCPTDYEHVSVKHTLETEIRFCDTLIIWTDCDREGENIGFEIASVCTAVNHNITIHRALFSEITAKSVQYAVDNLGKLNKHVSDAEDVRSQIDLRTGAAFTRFQTLRLRQAFPNLLRDNVLSYGTLQFPTLGIVVERHLEIKNFKTQPTWKIEATHADNDSEILFSWQRAEVFDYETCRILHRHCRKVGEAKVERIKSALVYRKRPQPLDTLELQKSASEKLKLTAKTVMNAAEKLYLEGFISYPRSEGNIFSEDTDLESLVQMQTHDNRWGNFASRVLEKVPDPREGIISDKFYPPIHPVKYTDSLTGIEAVVYEFVVRHFLASVSEDAVGNETTVIIDMDGEKFYATGLSIIEHNYLDVYPYDQWPTSDIRNYEKGQKFVPTTLNIVNKENPPPKHLTEATLIQLMKEHGIGITDATYAETIDKIKSRLYVSLQNGKNIIPAPLGMGLIEGYNSMGMGIHLSEPYLRAELEADLQRISEGEKDPKVVLEGQLEEYRKQYRIAQRHASKLDIALSNYLPHKPVPVQEEKKVPTYSSPVMKCPKCGSDIVLKVRPNNTGYYLSCLGFPSCKTSMWFPSNVVKLKVQTTSCSICGPRVKKLKFEFEPGSMQPFYPDTYVGCVICDLKLLELLKVRPISTTVKTTPKIESSEQQSPLSIRGVEEDNSQGDQILCRCELPAVLRTVRKEGRNKGRQFYVCQKPMEQQCKFIEWVDNIPARGGSPATNYQSQSSRTSMLNTATDQGVRCKCGLPAIKLTVKKEGRNKGKIFYKCSKPRNQQCDFIEWGNFKHNGDTGQTRNQFSYSATARFAKRTATDPRSESNRQKEFNSAINNQNDEASDNIICCHCGLPARKLTVKKEGRNKGKIFYKCPKPKYQQCDFVEWGDMKRPSDASQAHQQSPYAATARFTKGTATDTRSESNRQKDFSSSSNNQNNEASDNVICCDCGLPAKKRVVVRQSKNKGREYYVCPNQRDKQCKFFQWADEVPSGTGPRRANYKNIQEQTQYTTKSSFYDRKGSDSRSDDNPLKLSSQYSSRSNQNSESADDEKLCNCGLPAKKLTVVKEGPNKGRQFYVCAQPMNRKCKFFKWAKEKSAVSNDKKTSRITKSYKTTTASSGNSRVVSEELDFLNDIRFPSSVSDI